MSAPVAGSPVRAVARSGGLNVLGAGLSAVVGFGLTLVLTNGLSQAAAGTVFATTSLFLIATAVVQLGTESGMSRWLPVKVATGRSEEVRTVLAAGLVPSIVVSLGVAAAAVAGAPWVAGLITDGDAVDVATVTTQVRILAAFLPVAAPLNVVLASTRGLRTIRPTVLVESVGRSVLQLVAVGVVVALGSSAEVVVAAWAGPYVLALLVAVVWLLTLLRRVERRRGRLHPAPGAGDLTGAASRLEPAEAAGPRRGVREVGAEFWSFTGPRALATIAQTALKRSDIVLVAALRSPAEAAVYAAASRFVVLGQVGVQALQQALAPQLSAMFARDEKGAAQQVFQATATWSVMMAWPVYIACAVLAPVVLLLFGEGYTEGSLVVVVLSSAMLLAVASGPVDTVVLMSGRSWLSLGNTVAALVTNVGLNLVLIPRYGILGAAIAWAAAIVVRNVLPLWQVRRSLGMSPFSRSTALVAVGSVALFGVVPGTLALLQAGTWWVVAALAVGGVLYAVLLVRARERLHLDELVRSLRRSGGGRRGRGQGAAGSGPVPSSLDDTSR